MSSPSHCWSGGVWKCHSNGGASPVTLDFHRPATRQMPHVRSAVDHAVWCTGPSACGHHVAVETMTSWPLLGLGEGCGQPRPSIVLIDISLTVWSTWTSPQERSGHILADVIRKLNPSCFKSLQTARLVQNHIPYTSSRTSSEV
ncbi:unnamed protein product [Durusdinium trenchii]|uniref:Uncharacterized protein n=1 Tax=Durusdinium trenchii TaxID=1381693 RepID=A0ABP0K2P2_9DINO